MCGGAGKILGVFSACALSNERASSLSSWRERHRRRHRHRPRRDFPPICVRRRRRAPLRQHARREREEGANKQNVSTKVDVSQQCRVHGDQRTDLAWWEALTTHGTLA